RATAAYVGTFFHGWQRQKNAERTVQAVVEKALQRIDGGAVTVHAAGRTDTGVHADGQALHFDLASGLDPLRVREGANALLPWDVRLLDVAAASPDFHCRRDALFKEYLYRFSRAEVVAPRDALFVAPIARRADAALMAEAGKLLPGERDFGVFAVRAPEGQSGVRNLIAVTVEERGAEIRVLFRGDGFLRGMVRSICGVLADVARGKAPAGRVADLLETGNRRLLSPKAAACGLTLVQVHYEGVTLKR
ncbi:MAG: tRNA pseudouridine(38-40) synthase TruA, partial [Thermoanaerobaculia bacterium]